MHTTPELEIAKQAAQVGGEIVARYFRDGVVMQNKAGNGTETYNLVSAADVESEHAVADVIRQAFPDHAILGEEFHNDDVNSEHLWIIDPLDGTNNFAHAIPHFAVAVAYYHRGQAQCGVVFNPVRGDWFTAVKGGGAFAGDLRVQVGEQTNLNEALVGVGFYYDRGAMMEATLSAVRELFQCHIHGIRRFGTASLDLCQVGMGMFGAFFEYELAPWDFAAGRLFVEEAGGKITDCAGQALPIAKSSVLASNGKLHGDVLEIVKRHLP